MQAIRSIRSGITLSASALSVILHVPIALAEPVDNSAGLNVATTDGSSGVRPVQNRFVDEVIVTSQKREQNIQDVPLTVQAFSAESLDAKGITNPTDLPFITPGLTYTLLANYSVIYLRGIGTEAFIPSADASVATYIDGIYFPFASGLAQSFGALERIEVLKGPQGTLFGRNSTGGAINIITKKPGHDFETEFEISAAKYDDVKTRAYTNIPLTDTFALSISGLYNTADQTYKNVNFPLPKEVSKGARVKVRWTPTEDIDITLAALNLRNNGTSTLLAAQVHPKPIADVLLRGTPDEPYVTHADTYAYNYGRNNVLYGDAIWRTSWIDMRALVSHQDVMTDGLIDFDGTDLPLIGFEPKKAFSEIKTAELQFISNKTGWGSDWLEYIGGLYYIESDAGYDPVELLVGPYSGGVTPALGQILNPFLVPLLNQLGQVLPTTLAPVDVQIRGVLHTESSAAFAQGTATLTDWASLTIGGRYQTEKRGTVKNTVGLPNLEPAPISYAPQTAKTTNFSPKISLQLRPADEIMTYLSWTKGFKSGTYNIITVYTRPDYVKPEKVTTWELGVKSNLLNNSLRLNAAAFQNEVEDIQVQSISLASGGAVAFDNAGMGRIRGVEADVTWQPLPILLPGLVTNANATYLDAIYTKFKEGSGFDELTGLYYGNNSLAPLLTPGRDYSGNRITQTPKWSGNVGLGYTFEAGPGVVEVATDFNLNSGYYYTAQNSDRSVQDAYTVWNARMSYLHVPSNVRLTLFGRNLGDERYYYYNVETDFGTLGLYQPPRTFGVRFDWSF